MRNHKYKSYKQQKAVNKMKTTTVIASLFCIGFCIAFFINNENLIISSTGIEIIWKKPSEIVLEENDDYEIEEDTIIEEVIEQTIYNSFYFDASKAKDENYIQNLIEQYKNDEINAIVMPMKNYSGYIYYNTDLKYSNLKLGYDVQDALNEFLANDIYVIAEVFTYTDDLYVRENAKNGITTNSGNLFLDGDGRRTINPYSTEANTYINEILQEIESFGVSEIILAGYHFTEKGQLHYINYNDDEISREDILLENLENVTNLLNIPVSIRLSKSALLEDSNTFENPLAIAKIVNSVYIPVTTEEEKILFDELNIGNKGIISQTYSENTYNYINY